MFSRLVFFFSSTAPAICSGLQEDDDFSLSESESISPLSGIKFLPPGSNPICNKDIPYSSVDMERKRKRTTVTKRSPYFQPNEAGSSSTAGSPAKKLKSDKSSQDDHPLTTSQGSEDTLPYSIDAPCPEYDEKDFISDDGSDHCTEEGSDNAKSKSAIEISDNSSEDEDEAANRPWKKVYDTPPNKGKYTMRQTTLQFASKVKNVAKNPPKTERSVTRSRFKYSDFDTEEYRKGYPKKKDDPNLKDNLLFYKGSIESQPDGDFIVNIHQTWFGKYKVLERHHGYIQWLFPIRENGMNWHAQALQLHEAKAIQANKEAMLRVLTSYRLMLDFYGMKLVDPDTGKIERSARWKERFENLKWSSHNYLRITRILKSLGELGYEGLKKPFLEFVLHEALVEKTLERLLKSCEDYWIGTVKDDADREYLHKIIEERKRW